MTWLEQALEDSTIVRGFRELPIRQRQVSLVILTVVDGELGNIPVRAETNDVAVAHGTGTTPLSLAAIIPLLVQSVPIRDRRARSSKNASRARGSITLAIGSRSASRQRSSIEPMRSSVAGSPEAS